MREAESYMHIEINRRRRFIRKRKKRSQKGGKYNGNKERQREWGETITRWRKI